MKLPSKTASDIACIRIDLLRLCDSMDLASNHLYTITDSDNRLKYIRPWAHRRALGLIEDRDIPFSIPPRLLLKTLS